MNEQRQARMRADRRFQAAGRRRPQDIAEPLACGVCGAATEPEGAVYPEGLVQWGWPPRVCPTCATDTTPAGALHRLLVALRPDLAITRDEAVRLSSALGGPSRCVDTPLFSRFAPGHLTSWLWVLPVELSAWADKLTALREAIVPDGPVTGPGGLACGGCGRATAQNWAGRRVVVPTDLRRPGAPARVSLCADGPTSCATLLDRAGATGGAWRRHLAAIAGGLRSLPRSGWELELLEHAAIDPYGDGTPEPFAWVPSEMLTELQAEADSWPDLLIDDDRRRRLKEDAAERRQHARARRQARSPLSRRNR